MRRRLRRVVEMREGQTAFDDFKAAVTKIVSVPKPVVERAQKRQRRARQNRRKRA